MIAQTKYAATNQVGVEFSILRAQQAVQSLLEALFRRNQASVKAVAKTLSAVVQLPMVLSATVDLAVAQFHGTVQPA
jgi:hypothetical protein